ncbi:MAG: DUF3185 family protein [Treponema sp.]|nr:DUF3185 family protein [Treponema sp.]
MILFGVILSIAGIASLIWGIYANNSLEQQFSSVMSGGSGNPGTIFIIIGAVVLVIGIVLLIMGYTKKSKKSN